VVGENCKGRSLVIDGDVEDLAAVGFDDSADPPNTCRAGIFLSTPRKGKLEIVPTLLREAWTPCGDTFSEDSARLPPRRS
jgi:hypothetical protein